MVWRRRWCHSGALALLAATAALALPGHAQKVVRANSDRGKSELEHRIAELADPASRGDAQRALLRARLPGVPLLLDAVRREDATSRPALDVLVALRGGAAPAIPVLRRRHTEAANPALADALAKLDGPPVILAPLHNSDEVIELDMEGKVLRRVAATNPWCVEPAPDDRLHVLEFDPGRTREIDWHGKEFDVRTSRNHLTSSWELADGSRIQTHLGNGDCLQRVGPNDDVIWHKQNHTIRCVGQFDRIYAALGQQNKGLILDLDGTLLRTIEFTTSCLSIRPLPDGHLLTTLQDGDKGCLRVIGADGDVVREYSVMTRPHDAVMLHDGRIVVFGSEGVQLLGPDGDSLWMNKTGYTGPGFVRE